MKTTSTALCGLVTALLTSAALLPHAEAITIAHGGDSVDIDFVDIGNVGNTGDTANTVNGANPGAVNYEYSIGTYEVTSDQWAAVAGFDALVEDNSNDPWTGSQPTANASWYEAAKFANWLTSGDALQGAYGFSDATTFTGVDRDTALTTFGTIYVLPTEDEWYKAAYLKSDGSGYTLYATGDQCADSGNRCELRNVVGSPWNVGSGSVENNGTYDMGGNVWEWGESAFAGGEPTGGESRVLRGGAWYDSPSTCRRPTAQQLPGLEDFGYGFRVASVSVVPEPSSVGLLVIGAMGCMLRRKRG